MFKYLPSAGLTGGPHLNQRLRLPSQLPDLPVPHWMTWSHWTMFDQTSSSPLNRKLGCETLEPGWPCLGLHCVTRTQVPLHLSWCPGRLRCLRWRWARTYVPGDLVPLEEERRMKKACPHSGEQGSSECDIRSVCLHTLTPVVLAGRPLRGATFLGGTASSFGS